MHRIHSSDLSKQCVSTFILSIESLVTVTQADVRLFNRYRRPLGLDHKLAQRMEICQSPFPYASM